MLQPGMVWIGYVRRYHSQPQLVHLVIRIYLSIRASICSMGTPDPYLP